MQAPAVRIRRRCDTSTRFDYNRSHLTPSPGTSGQIVKLRFSPGGYWISVPHSLPEPLPVR